MIEPWQKVFREGAVPHLSTETLIALKTGLETDDPRLIQDATTSPPPFGFFMDWDVEGACLLGYCGWIEGLQFVGEVETYFLRMCFAIDQKLGPTSVRHLLTWYDDTDRQEMRRRLLEEVNLALEQRKTECPP